MDIRNTLNQLTASQKNAEPTTPGTRVNLSSLESLALKTNQRYQATVLESVRSNQARSGQGESIKAGESQTGTSPAKASQNVSAEGPIPKTGAPKTDASKTDAPKTDASKTNTLQTNPLAKNETLKNETSKSEAGTTQSSNIPKTSDVLPKPSSNQWVIQIQGKNLLVESPIPLQVGQGLILELKTNGPQGQAVLDISPLSTGLPRSSESSHSNLATAQLSNTLLKSLTRLIANQSPLDAGLNQLLAQSSSPKNVQDQALWHLLRPLILQETTLLKALQPDQLTQLSKLLDDSSLVTTPQSSVTSNVASSGAASSSNLKPNLTTSNLTASNDVAIGLLKQVLAQSGLGFESSLLKGATQHAQPAHNQGKQNPATQGQTISNTSAQIMVGAHALQQSLALTDKLLNASQGLSEKQLVLLANALVGKQGQNQSTNSAQGLNSTQANNSTTAPGTQATNATTGFKQPELTAFKAWLQQALGTQPPNPAHTGQAASQASVPPQKPSIGSDLKSVLLALTASLQNGINSERSTAGLSDSASNNGLQYDLPHNLKQALEFPRVGALIAQVEGQMKASAMLADQELSTGQLLKLLASMLNRIQFNQLNSLYQSQTGGQEGQATQSWMFELPMQHQNGHVSSIQLRIDQHQQEQDEERARKEENANKEIEWKLSLAFQLDELGPMHIQVALAPPRISPIVWCESPETYSLLRQEQGVLTQQLTALGLNVEDIHCHRGRPKPQHNPIERSLIDLKA